MSSAAPVRRATVEDLLAIPEDQRRHELIDGVLLEKEGATSRHGAARLRLGRALGPYDRKPGGRWPGGWWFATEVEVLFGDDVLRPDVVGWRRERLACAPDEFPVRTRPDWICEILSTKRRNDLIKKKRAYHRSELPHYWLVDPELETLTVLRHRPEGYLEVLAAERDQVVRAEPFDEIELHIGVLFGDDEE